MHGHAERNRVKPSIRWGGIDLTKRDSFTYNVSQRLRQMAELEAQQLKREGKDKIRAPGDNLVDSCIGELVVQGVLYELEVPSIRNPVFLHELFPERVVPWKERPDFWTSIGTFDVKTTSQDTEIHHYRLMLANKNRWDAIANPDYALAVKIENNETAQVYGTIVGSDVDKQPSWCRNHRDPRGCTTTTCTESLCYQVPLDDFLASSSDTLLPGTFLLRRLMHRSRNPKIREMARVGTVPSAVESKLTQG